MTQIVSMLVRGARPVTARVMVAMVAPQHTAVSAANPANRKVCLGRWST